MIIETTANQLYRVRESENPDLRHCWIGVRVKWMHGRQKFVAKDRERFELVRKSGCRIIDEE